MSHLHTRFLHSAGQGTNSLPSHSNSIDVTDFESVPDLQKQQQKQQDQSSDSEFFMPAPIVHNLPNSSAGSADTPLPASDSYFVSLSPFSNASNTTMFDSETIANASSQTLAGGANCVTNFASCPIAQYVQVIADSYLLPLVIIGGLLGNALNLRVLTRRELRSPTTTFLRAMAAADALVLALQLPHMLALLLLGSQFASRAFNVLLALYYPYIRFPLTNMVLTFSVYCRVAVTLERTLAFNTSRRAGLQRRKACYFFEGARGTQLLLGLIAGVSALINLHKCFYFHHVPLDAIRANDTLQQLVPPVSELQKTLNKVAVISWMSLAISSVIPGVLLVTFTSVLLVRLHRYSCVAARLRTADGSHGTRLNSNGSNSANSCNGSIRLNMASIELPPPLPITARPKSLQPEKKPESSLEAKPLEGHKFDHVHRAMKPLLPRLKMPSSSGSISSEQDTQQYESPKLVAYFRKVSSSVKQSSLTSSNRVSLSTHQSNAQRAHCERERERRRTREIRLAATVTVMVSSVVLVFVATAAPNIYLEVAINLFTRDVALANEPTMTIRFISNLCVFLNCGANFLLFCFTSAQYRHLFLRELRDLICAATCRLCGRFGRAGSPNGRSRMNTTLADDNVNNICNAVCRIPLAATERV